jgi:probable HAF family extracellular repeat protein
MKKQLALAALTLLFGSVNAVFGATQHAFIWDETNGMRDLGSLGDDSSAIGINDSGTVVGWYVLGNAYRGFFWTEATGMVDLGVPGGVDDERVDCFPTAINSAGNVVGYGRQANGKQVAFFWTPSGGFTTLGKDSSAADNGNTAYAINDNNEVTGNLLTGERGLIYHAYLWSPEMKHPRDLGTVAGANYSVGYGINNLGHIVGGSLSTTTDNTWYPMIWTDQKGMRLIGTITGATWLEADHINGSDEIIGFGFSSAGTFSFYKSPHGGLRIIHGFRGDAVYANAINQLGVIAGATEVSPAVFHAVIWPTPSSVPQDLGSIAGGSSARGLNNVGQVVGDSGF